MTSRWTRLLPLVVWIAMILWVASRPKTTFFPTDMKTICGISREFFQYPYHFGAFFILAILFRRGLSRTTNRPAGWKTVAFSFLGCAAVSVCSELLQFYVPTRTPAVRDLAVDQSGAMFALTVMRHFSEKIVRLGR